MDFNTMLTKVKTYLDDKPMTTSLSNIANARKVDTGSLEEDNKDLVMPSPQDADAAEAAEADAAAKTQVRHSYKRGRLLGAGTCPGRRMAWGLYSRGPPVLQRRQGKSLSLYTQCTSNYHLP